MYVDTAILGILIGCLIVLTLECFRTAQRLRASRKIASRMLARAWNCDGGDHLAWILFNNSYDHSTATYAEEQMDDWYKLISKLEV
jgi:hypothetical protein